MTEGTFESFKETVTWDEWEELRWGAPFCVLMSLKRRVRSAATTQQSLDDYRTRT
jgi:hypothetical protein